MNGAVAPDNAATAPQERGWRWFVVALVLMVTITAAPAWPPTLALVGGLVRLLLPVEQFALLVLVSIATCSIVGWWRGGRLVFALAWFGLAATVVWFVPLPIQGYGAFVRGWALALGAAFGLVCLATGARPFLGRALAAVALAGAVSVAGFATRAPVAGGSFDEATRMLGNEYQRRLGESLTGWHNRTDSGAWQSFSRQMPEAAARADRMATVLAALGDARQPSPKGPLLLLSPTLLALESLLALGLGWAAYHRLSRVRIGPPLGLLRDLRFNDQLIWGLVVGVTLLLLPTLSEWRTPGANFFCFFGTLYALRGAGVLTWWIPDRIAVVALLALLILIPLLGPVWVLAVVLATTFGLGLGDTWRDFRVGTRRPSSLL